VTDFESGPDAFSEHSKSLNPTLKGRDIRKAFKATDYQILLVANKFQTGFDQPLLCGMYVDKRLAGIQAVQTLSRLNRACPGKDTTYVLDFVNEPEEVLAAFKTYYSTATLSATTDPNIIYDLRSKLDAAGHYDDDDIDRLVVVELNPAAKQGDLAAAIGPVARKLLSQYKAAQETFKTARAQSDGSSADSAQSEMNALALFKRDMGAFVRLYTFLSQVFDYGNTAIEKRAIFYKRLIPLLDFGREREGIDLSKLVLTHHQVKNLGKQAMPLRDGETPQLEPITEAGSGSVQERQKALLREIIERVNDLFEGDLTDEDKLVYVNNGIKGKLLESQTLQQQAANNTKEQFAHSPNLNTELTEAIMDALDAHTAMSKQALNSPAVRESMKDILLNYVGLWEALRERAHGAAQT
jgi:type I restriction enzyme R subunit